jgi:uncharacterized protein
MLGLRLPDSGGEGQAVFGDWQGLPDEFHFFCPMKTFAFRLRPGFDLKVELFLFAQENSIQAGVILTCVGSLRKAALRMAGQDTIRTWEEKLEIVSLAGTVSAEGVHLHIAVADGEGHVYGGHLMDGCIIYTTAEIAIGDLEGLKFTREMDPETGYKELKVHNRNSQG